MSYIAINAESRRSGFPPPDCTFDSCRDDRAEQIRQAKQEWEFTADSMPQLILLLDREDHVLRVNRTLEQWGLGRVVDAPGRKIHDLLHPHCHDADCRLKNIWRSSVDQMAQDLAVEYQTEDKFLQRHLNLHFRFHCSPLDPAAGSIVAVISDISDIKQAERKMQNWNDELERRVEENTFALISTNIRLQQEIEKQRLIAEKLERSRREYSQLVEAMNQGLAILDRQGKITYANQRFCDTLGHPRDEILGRTPVEYAAAENRIAVERHMAERIRGGTATYVASLEGTQGQKFRIKISPTLLSENQGDATGSFAVIADNVEPMSTKPLPPEAGTENGEQHSHADQSRFESEHERRMLTAQVLSAQEKERKRIASELHDGIGQTLSAIKFYVENAIRNLNEQTIENSAQTFGDVIPKLQDAIEEIRRISMDLRPSLLDDIGTLAALAWFCRESQSLYKPLRIELTHDIGESDIPSTLKVAIFRIAQEAVNNCARHGRANCVRISLINSGTQIELAVEDDGRGFDLAETGATNRNPAGGMGLVSMRERAEFSGGTFSIRSEMGRGTCIRAAWPFQETRDGL